MSSDAAGRTPLHLAAWGDSRRVAELLLRHGAALQTSERARSEYWVWNDTTSARVIVSMLLRRAYAATVVTAIELTMSFPRTAGPICEPSRKCY